MHANHLQDPRFLDSIRRALQARLIRAPDDTQLLFKLGSLLRAQGALEEAREVYCRLLTFRPTCATTAWTIELLSDGGNGPSVGLPRPGAFYRRTDFLPAGAQREIWAQMMAKKQDFAPLKLKRLGKGPKVERLDLELRDQSGAIFHEGRDILRPHIEQIFPDLLRALGISSFAPTLGRVTATLTHDGQFGGAHLDGKAGDAINIMYYACREPKQFRGGDLLIYDEVSSEAAEYEVDRYTKVPFVNNSLVAFPCWMMHAITGVTCDSIDLADGRFAVAVGVSIPPGTEFVDLS